MERPGEENPLSKIKLCAPCCSNCPEVFVDKEGMVNITDDNEPGKIRTVKLTKEQFEMLCAAKERVLS